jgi:hypothetical protein
MTRLFWVGILLLAFAAPAFANVPTAENSSVAWVQTIGPGAVWVCPKADNMSDIEVTVRDQFNLPMNAVLVTATIANPLVAVKAPIQGFTDVNGHLHLLVHAGVNATGAAPGPAISTGVTVTCLGVQLFNQPTYMLSPDLDGLNIVGALDFSIFATDYLKSLAIPPGCRSDFDQNGTVNQLDFSKFALHFGQVFP